MSVLLTRVIVNKFVLTLKARTDVDVTADTEKQDQNHVAVSEFAVLNFIENILTDLNLGIQVPRSN